MMKLFNKLSSLGGAVPKGMPIDASNLSHLPPTQQTFGQINPNMVDRIGYNKAMPRTDQGWGTIPTEAATGMSYDKPVGVDWGAVGKAGLGGLLQYVGAQGGQGGVEHLDSPASGPSTRGGNLEPMWNAEQLSGLRGSSQQRWAQAPGLLQGVK